jgi:hypothetical protein
MVAAAVAFRGCCWVGGYLLLGAKKGVTGMMWLRRLSISCRFGSLVVGDRSTDWVEVYLQCLRGLWIKRLSSTLETSNLNSRLYQSCRK